MIRIVIENIFFFLLPTLLYVAWIAFRRNDWPGVFTILREAPLGKLFIAGAILMLTTLVLLSSRSTNMPRDVYEPPVMRDGVLQPGRRIPAPTP
jgi:hypothetical protein